jgi:hypothetical protein
VIRQTTPLAASPATAVKTGEYDDRWYPYPPTGADLASVTSVIGGTDAKPWKPGWYARTTAAYWTDNLPLAAATLKTLGRNAAIDLSKDEAERIRDQKADAGKHVHAVTEALSLWAAARDGEGANITLPTLPAHLEGVRYDFGDGAEEPPLLADVVKWMVDGFINFVAAFGGSMKIAAAEMTVYDVRLGVAGTLDLIIILTGYAISRGTGPGGEDEIVACPGSVLVICVDIKTGKALEGTWQEQIGAYRRMTECDPSRMGDLRPMPTTDAGAVLHLRPDYPDGWLLVLVSSAVDDAAYSRFCDATRVFLGRQKVKDRPGPSIRPLRADGTMPPPRLCDVAGMGYGRALAPLRKALGADAELTAVAEFDASDLLKVKGVGVKLIEVIRQMLADHHLALNGDDVRAALRAVPAGTVTGWEAA